MACSQFLENDKKAPPFLKEQVVDGQSFISLSLLFGYAGPAD